MKYLSFIIMCSFLIVGCSREQSHNELLVEAERTVFEHPDSAVRLLESFWGDTTLTEADQALYGLVYTEALHRSGLSTASDSLILTSRRYYEATGDEARLARALLHHGIVLYKQQQANRAVLTMKQAEQLAASQDAPAFKWFLYAVLGDVNDNVGNYTLTLRYYRQALTEARACHNDDWTVRTLNNIAQTFDLLGERDSLQYYTKQAQPLAPKTDGEVRATYLVNQASLKLQVGKRREAKDCLLRAQAISPTDRGAKLLTDIYIIEGDSTAAIDELYRLTHSLSPDVAIKSYRMLIRLLRRQGDTAGVARYSQQLNDVYQRLYERSDAAGITDLQMQYDEQQRERRQYQTTIALLATVLLLSLFVAASVWYHRRRIDQLNARFAQSQQRYDLTRRQLTQMRRQKEREQLENSRQLKDVIARLHGAADRGQSADDEDLSTLAQLSFAQSPKLRELLSVLNTREQTVCLLTRHNFLPTEIATLTISTPQTITNTRVRLLKKLFDQTGGAKDFDIAIKRY